MMRGKNRQTWSRTVTAEITILDEGALHAAAEQAAEDALTIELPDDLEIEDIETGTSDHEKPDDAFDALGWLIWPTDGIEDLQVAGAVLFVSAVSEVVPVSDDRGTATWTVAVKLTDVDALRRLATEANPAEAGLIAESLEVAWQHAADPFEPLRSIPGIAWQPGRVDVEHLPARPRKAPGQA
jgi:hypothetical protein